MSVNPETPMYLKIAEQFEKERSENFIPQGIAFDDVILLPGRSVIDSTLKVDTSSYLAPNIKLKNPIISANMDSVTGDRMAIAMALNGAIGAIHRGMRIEEQVEAIRNVKNFHQLIIEEPPILSFNDTVGRAKEIMESHNRGYVVILDHENRITGIVTTRDINYSELDNSHLINNGIMTSQESGLVCAPPDITIEEAERIMWINRIEKLLIIDSEGNLFGVITQKDIDSSREYPNATKDTKGRLQVIGSVGISESAVYNAKALVEAGADGIIIDVLHGDTPRVRDLAPLIKKEIGRIPLIVGNVATKEQTQDLVDVGADIVKVGWGPGSFCTTRIVTGTGASQFKAIIESASVAYKHNKKIIADGGIRYPADIVKSLYAGAASVMIGGLLVGSDESPGEILVDEYGMHYKLGRGSASSSAASELAKAVGKVKKNHTPQGVEAVKVKHTGPVSNTIHSLIDGVRHGIGNIGAWDIESLQINGRLERQSSASLKEADPHIKNR